MLFIGPSLLGHITWVGLRAIQDCQWNVGINKVMIEWQCFGDVEADKCLSLSRGGFGVRNSELCLFVEECKNYRKQEKVQQCQSDETDLNIKSLWIIYLN